MPRRRTPFVTGEIYHVFNRGIARQPIFLSKRDYERAIETINFYGYRKPPLRFSHYNRLPKESKEKFLGELKLIGVKQVKLFAFCLMPNHVHLLIQGLIDNGISDFMGNFQNSYAKYFNTRTGRSGAVLQAMFKAVRIESEEQLLHVCRYMHLNPYSSYICKDLKGLEDYSWSSLRGYLGLSEYEFLDSSLILNLLGSREKFKDFTFDQADYQKRLEDIKHLVLE